MMREILLTWLVISSLTVACFGESATVRIRFANGKTGKPLRLKSYERGNMGGDSNYKVDRIEGDSLIVTFTNVTSFAFRSAAFDPCDTKSKPESQPKYNLQEVSTLGVVSPNFCGRHHAKPVAGELLIYSRHQRWWEITGNIARGVLICG